MHAKLIRTQTEALGGEYCGYFITGNKEGPLGQCPNGLSVKEAKSRGGFRH